MPETSNRRRQIETPLGPCQELGLEHFLDHVLPPLQHGIDPARIVAAMKTSGRASFNKTITKNGRWRGFARDPAYCERSTYDTFKPLEAVVKAIVKVASTDCSDLKPTSHFWSNPDPATACSSRSIDRLPDAAFQTGLEHEWKNVAVCGEYQMEDDSSDNVNQNIRKVTCSMANCMFENPRRRFVFGFTIENTEMRLWFCDRRSILASQPFNFITDHLHVVHFFVSILYADPHQLGWDTSMVLQPDGHNFDLAICSGEQTRTYRTQEILLDRGRSHLLGKATRVWKAVRVEDGKDTSSSVVVKDYWVRSEYPREGDTIRRIHGSISAPEDADLAASLFLDVEWDGDVLVNNDDTMLDSTLSLPSDTDTQASTAHESEAIDGPQASETASARRLVHYRVVLIPVGTRPIHQETSLWNIFNALSDTARALQILHKSGWVHRDISIGNIITGEGQTRLADFEYAKRASDEDDLSIGTEYFKAFEVDTKSYAFVPPAKPLKKKLLNEEELLKFVLEDIEPPLSPMSPSEWQLPAIPPVRYNPLHDLESLWWVAVYFVLKREVRDAATSDSTPQTEVEWDREAQRKYADSVFYCEGDRCGIIMMPDTFYRNALRAVHPKMHPVIRILEDLRLSLVQRYTEVEKDAASIAWTCGAGLYEKFNRGCAEIANRPELRHVHLPPIPEPAPPGPTVSALAVAAERKRVAEQKEKDVQAAKDATKKTGKARRRRKAPATAVPAHRYNLRPRPTRS